MAHEDRRMNGREERVDRGKGTGGVAPRVLEQYSVREHRCESRCRPPLVSVGIEVVRAQGVHHDDDDVSRVLVRRLAARERDQNQEPASSTGDRRPLPAPHRLTRAGSPGDPPSTAGPRRPGDSRAPAGDDAKSRSEAAHALAGSGRRAGGNTVRSRMNEQSVRTAPREFYALRVGRANHGCDAQRARLRSAKRCSGEAGPPEWRAETIGPSGGFRPHDPASPVGSHLASRSNTPRHGGILRCGLALRVKQPRRRRLVGGAGSRVRTGLCGRIPCFVGKVQGNRPLPGPEWSIESPIRSRSREVARVFPKSRNRESRAMNKDSEGQCNRTSRATHRANPTRFDTLRSTIH
jgi:hypothetical protein